MLARGCGRNDAFAVSCNGPLRRRRRDETHVGTPRTHVATSWSSDHVQFQPILSLPPFVRCYVLPSSRRRAFRLSNSRFRDLHQLRKRASRGFAALWRWSKRALDTWILLVCSSNAWRAHVHASQGGGTHAAMRHARTSIRGGLERRPDARLRRSAASAGGAQGASSRRQCRSACGESRKPVAQDHRRGTSRRRAPHAGAARDAAGDLRSIGGRRAAGRCVRRDGLGFGGVRVQILGEADQPRNHAVGRQPRRARRGRCRRKEQGAARGGRGQGSALLVPRFQGRLSGLPLPQQRAWRDPRPLAQIAAYDAG
mmetsp:Transcript_3442/g.21549  ORF Transcript_3442/g.21549 Transcript_3442/m.21549 type:complete len:312 (-) Transcript_3442:2191-3126(-)